MRILKILKIIVTIIAIVVACYWLFTRDMSKSPLLMTGAGLLFIITGLETLVSSENKRKDYMQLVLGVILVLLAFL
ncbi:hypothetical protein RCG24_07670 [Neobacillus sp. OS1-32]|jgi:uncharacterized MnhB-related membrane protein|uniref:hypothetical protein n=1 Tax=Neobacillus sp. OS1-32 TaxID=3070682 RepID=UPI0027E0F45A|nr:hypothetical protein [Neobacillus sp. OS1-32]WML31722.1 hypothetical protein RCG24_07670 [Neobacillus sp. OS1-32]